MTELNAEQIGPNLELAGKVAIVTGGGRDIGRACVMKLAKAGASIAINYHFWATRGQSIGKLAVGIKIVRTDGSQATAGRIIGLRFLVMAVVSLFGLVGSIISLVDVLLIFRKERNCLHDDIADTRVIVAQPTPISY